MSPWDRVPGVFIFCRIVGEISAQSPRQLLVPPLSDHLTAVECDRPPDFFS